MKSTHQCEQLINSDGLLTESSCAEEHIFRPFSSGSNGAMTEVYYKIHFNKESPGIKSRQGRATASTERTTSFQVVCC